MPEITVGLSISLTGALARQGQQALNGLLLWESYVNGRVAQALLPASEGRQEGLSYRPLRLVYYDDESRGSRARQNAARLLDENRVDVLFGPYGSGLTLAVAPIAEERKKLLWDHGGSSDEIFNRGYRGVVGGPSPASDYFRGLVGPAFLPVPLPRILIAYSPRGTFASHVARGLAEAAAAAGLPPVERVAIGSPLPSPEAIVDKVVATSPEVVALAASFQEEVAILRTRRLWPSCVKEIAAVAAGVRNFYEELGKEAEGVIGPSQWEPESPAPANYPLPVRPTLHIPQPDSQWFVRSFQERFGRPPEYTAAGSFAMGLVFQECARRAGSLEDARLWAAATALDFSTFYGRFRIDPETGRQLEHSIALVRWQEGRKVPL